MAAVLDNMQKNRKLRTRSRLLSAAVASCFVGTLNATSLPTGGVVAHGSASFAQAGNTLTITNSNGTIINWNTFSIGKDYTTNFIQSSACSRRLNIDPGCRLKFDPGLVAAV